MYMWPRDNKMRVKERQNHPFISADTVQYVYTRLERINSSTENGVCGEDLENVLIRHTDGLTEGKKEKQKLKKIINGSQIH